MWSRLAKQAKSHRVKFGVGSFTLLEGHLSETCLAYKDELQKSLDPLRFDLIAIPLQGLVNLG